MQFIDSASAAVRAAGLHLGADDEQTVLVCDFGGSDLTFSVVKVSLGTIEMLARECKRDIGGNFIDDKLVSHCLQKFKTAKGVDKSEDENARRRLKQACERAKITMSKYSEATVRLSSFSGPHDLEVKVTLDELKALTAAALEFEPLLDRVGGSSVLSFASMDASKINKVLLVGGSSNIPWVVDKLKKKLNSKQPSDVLSAEECVAEGAAILAAELSPSYVTR